MRRFPCPYLNADVELTDERASHIAGSHPELLPERFDLIAAALEAPDRVLKDPDYPRTRLLARWFPDLLGGKLVIVAVVSDPPSSVRHWIVTAFISRGPARGEVEWNRP